MNRDILKILPLALLTLGLATGCPKSLKTEDISETAPVSIRDENKQQAKDKTEAVPDDRIMAENLPAQDSPLSKHDRQYKGNDELTKRAIDQGILYTIHFDYDRYQIKEEDKALLVKNAKWLSINPGVKVMIEGHADERGEAEYNLALGDKRAFNVMKYLEDMGISTDRVSIISYGEEDPADSGHDEDAWSRNRRAEFKIVN